MNHAPAQPAGLVALEAIVFVLGVVVLGGLLVWFGRRIFTEDR